MSRKKKVDTKHLFHAVCPYNVIPVRNKPAIDQLMITQMLFGEVCEIVEKKNKHWYKIKFQSDENMGWVMSSQICLISDEVYHKYLQNTSLVLEVCQSVFNEESSKSIVLGSSLPLYDGISCTLSDGKYIYNGQVTNMQGLEYSDELIVKIARRYLWSPELPGGRSPFGIDSSAMIQMIYRLFGRTISRHAHEQSKSGEVIDFVDLAKEGDLAFCHDDSGQICHVGMIVGPKKVLHVHGCARIDKIDHFGIYNMDLRKYTHKLRIIKRTFP
jgi:gamma-D-glutamyl-L-lysine dipeptidyl-peptidase